MIFDENQLSSACNELKPAKLENNKMTTTLTIDQKHFC